MLLHRCGSVADLDVDSLSALAAGAFASGREMARLIGETSFDVAMQQGRRNHLEMIRAGESAILLAVFDDHTTAALVRLHGQRAARRLAEALAAGQVEAGGAGTGVREAVSSLIAAGPEREGNSPSEFLSQSESRSEHLRSALVMRTLSLVVALLAAAVFVLGALLRH
jgi:predicted regulator of Ras-like GTPase activity (Roadblock/LC7/MglB family)